MDKDNMEYNPTIRKDKILLFITSQIKLEGIILSQIQSGLTKYRV